MERRQSPKALPRRSCNESQIAALQSLVALLSVACALLVALLAGCVSPARITLPSDDLLTRGQLRIHHDFELSNKHRLVNELDELRGDLLKSLALSRSDEPIHIYLFENESQFGTYVSSNFPQFPVRRAFFTRTDTQLSVYAFWGDLVGDDLRHETTHAYLHSVVPQIPLWLDEGLAEYYELPRGSRGLHWEHLNLLARKRMEGQWVPNLQRLEQLASSGQMTQIDYAEAWLWTHLLLNSSPDLLALLQSRLRALHETGENTPWAEELEARYQDSRSLADTHLQHLIRLEQSAAGVRE